MTHSTPLNPDIHFEMRGDIAVVRLTRPTKRNALNDALIAALRQIFENLPANTRAAVIAGDGEHFCAGLDLSDLKERDAGQGMHHSRSWHVALERVQYGPVPVVAALHGAVRPQATMSSVLKRKEDMSVPLSFMGCTVKMRKLRPSAWLPLMTQKMR